MEIYSIGKLYNANNEALSGKICLYKYNMEEVEINGVLHYQRILPAHYLDCGKKSFIKVPKEAVEKNLVVGKRGAVWGYTAEDLIEYAQKHWGMAREEHYEDKDLSPVMTKARAIELLNSVVDHVAAGENLSGQFEELTRMGFTRDDLLCFGYNKNDLDQYEVE